MDQFTNPPKTPARHIRPDIAEKLKALKKAKAKNVFVMSGVSRNGVIEVLRQMRKVIEAGREAMAGATPSAAHRSARH